MKTTFSLLIILLLFVFLFFTGMQIGSFETSLTEMLEVIFNYQPSDTKHFAIVELRIPRLLIAFAAGSTLALSGYLMQAMVSNPLADPYLLGTSSGASLGASLAYAGFIPVTVFSVSLFSFTGAMGVTLLAVMLSYEKGNIIPSRLLLAGVALSALMVSMMSLVTYLSGDDSRLKNIIYWTLGGFELAGWQHVPLLLSVVILLIFFFSIYQKHLNILLLGEQRAVNLGVNVRMLRWLVLLGCSLATGIAVSVAGPIGFAGLIIPHFVRSVYGVSGKNNILMTALWGGIFILSCDVLSRLIYPPAGVPIGIITSFAGIPFFIFLLGKNRIRF